MSTVDFPAGSHDQRSCRSRSRSRSRSRNDHLRICSNRYSRATTCSNRRSAASNVGSGIGFGFGIEPKYSSRHDAFACDRGTSLVELLVVLALLSVMVLVAAQLIVHSLQLLDATGRAVRNPLVVHVCSRLRHDIQEAAALQGEEWSWTDDPLILVHHDGSRVRIAIEGENLVREKTDGAGEAPEQRIILRGVTSWWWRCPVSGVVDLNITYLVNPAPERRISRDPGYGLERRKENLRFAIRGGDGGTRW